MPSLICPRCKAKTRFAASDTDQTVTCPSCGYQTTVPAKKPTPLPASPSPPTPESQADQTPQPSPVVRQRMQRPPTLPGGGFRAFLLTISAIFIFVGFSSVSSFSRYSQTRNRFQTDNAVGASANALEHLAERGSSADTAQWFTLALLCWLVASVERLRYAVETGMQSPPPRDG
jgi:hypothetical protein